jgi:hypothetical protein
MTFPNPRTEKQKDPLEFIRSQIQGAMSIGIQAYNLGDYRGCYEVYACTARLLLQGVKGAEEERATLRHALEQCGVSVDVKEMTWIMRRAFDAVLGKDCEPGL